jgi:hypothetical protein
MEGIHITTNTDYSTGPGPRVVMTIDCENIPENYWAVEMQEELVKDAKLAFAEMTKFNSNDLSIVLVNHKLETSEDEYSSDRFNIDLSEILAPLDNEFHMKTVWVHTENDFSDIYSYMHGDFSNYYCKAEKYVVCGKYDPDNSEINVQGEQCEFPVKALYRKSFNQKIWKINKNSARDVTAKIDHFYNIWKNQ